MALSSRAHAFSVEALVGRPSKRKLQDPREEMQPELLEKEGGEEEDRRSSAAAGTKSEPPGKYLYRSPNPCASYPSLLGPKVSGGPLKAAWGLLAQSKDVLALSKDVLAQLLAAFRAAGISQPSGCRGKFQSLQVQPIVLRFICGEGEIPTGLWSESLQPPGNPESQRMAVAQSKKQGKDPDPQVIQHQGPKFSKRDESGKIWRSVMHFTGHDLGPLFSIKGDIAGILKNLEISRQGSQERDKAGLFWDRRQWEGGARLRSSLKLCVSLFPTEKRTKTDPLATTFGFNSFGSLEEKDIIQVELQGSELWKRFHDIGTEMIITKAGRFGFAQVVQGLHTVGT